MKIGRYLLLLCWITGLHHKTRAQGFITQGQIEFEYKINLYAQFDGDNDDTWKEFIKKNMPQFKSTFFTLSFLKDKTLYKPGKENPENDRLWFGENVADENIIYSDLLTHQAVSQKKVFEKLFLIKDSTRKINWKITNELRMIAGFECRRANAVIMDSIYVVAFYTDEITTTGGPESFCGLPGMILGVALPHEHKTWFATRLYNKTVKDTDLAEPVKGKITSNAALKENLKESLKDWGKYADKYVKQIML
jgi:GLPGLI family protein